MLTKENINEMTELGFSAEEIKEYEYLENAIEDEAAVISLLAKLPEFNSPMKELQL